MAQMSETAFAGTSLALTRMNALRHGLSGRVHALVGDLLDPIAGPLDLVVANLPYLPGASGSTGSWPS